jgi:hypothetical protein
MRRRQLEHEAIDPEMLAHDPTSARLALAARRSSPRRVCRPLDLRWVGHARRAPKIRDPAVGDRFSGSPRRSPCAAARPRTLARADADRRTRRRRGRELPRGAYRRGFQYRVTLFHGDGIRACTLPRPVIVRRCEHLGDHDADPIDQDDRRDGCRVWRLADAAKERPRSPGQLEVADEQRDRSGPAPLDAAKAKRVTSGRADASIKRRIGRAERAGREPRLGTIVKLARALAYPPCKVLAGI